MSKDDDNNDGLGRRAVGAAAGEAVGFGKDFAIGLLVGGIPFADVAVRMALKAGQFAVGELWKKNGQAKKGRIPHLDLMFEPKPYELLNNNGEAVGEIYCISAPLKDVAPTDIGKAQEIYNNFQKILKEAQYSTEESEVFQLRPTGTEGGKKHPTGWEICSFSNLTNQMMAIEDRDAALRLATELNRILPASPEQVQAVFARAAARNNEGLGIGYTRQVNVRDPMGIGQWQAAAPRRAIAAASAKRVSKADLINNCCSKFSPTRLAYPTPKNMSVGMSIEFDRVALDLEKEFVNSVITKYNVWDQRSTEPESLLEDLAKQYDELARKGRFVDNENLHRNLRDPNKSLGQMWADQFAFNVLKTIHEAHQGPSPRTR